MGKINMGILDGFEGKVGTVVGYKVHGKAFMRAYVGKMANPRTKAQMLVRERFGKIIKMSSAMKSAIDLGFAAVAKQHRHTTGNAFVSANIAAIDEQMEVKYNQLMLAQGRLTTPSFGSASAASGNNVTVNFSGAGGEEEGEKKVYLFAYSEEAMAGKLSAGADGATGSVSVQADGSWSGSTVHVWGFVAGKNGASKSSYIGTVEIV